MEGMVMENNELKNRILKNVKEDIAISAIRKELNMEKVPLWNGSHGYKGCYEYDIACKNPYCRCRVYLGLNDTVYKSDEKAQREAIKHWNRRVSDEGRCC